MGGLATLRLMRLADFVYQSAWRAFPRVSGLSDFEWRVPDHCIAIMTANARAELDREQQREASVQRDPRRRIRVSIAGLSVG